MGDMRTLQIEGLRAGGWETVTFEEVTRVTLASAPGAAGLSFTLIGHRDDHLNQVESGIRDIAQRHDTLIATPVPRRDTGENLVRWLQTQQYPVGPSPSSAQVDCTPHRTQWPTRGEATRSGKHGCGAFPNSGRAESILACI